MGYKGRPRWRAMCGFREAKYLWITNPFGLRTNLLRNLVTTISGLCINWLSWPNSCNTLNTHNNCKIGPHCGPRALVLLTHLNYIQFRIFCIQIQIHKINKIHLSLSSNRVSKVKCNSPNNTFFVYLQIWSIRFRVYASMSRNFRKF
jgi:hypothetical protein